MDLSDIVRRCESRLRRLTVPDPFDISALAESVGMLRGRRLRLIEKETALGPCGVWLATPHVDYVFYEATTSDMHREHIVLHELGHLLCDHSPSEHLDSDVIAELFPGLDAGVVRRVLGRTSYTAVEEQEAELLASMVRARVDQREARRPPSAADPALAEVLLSTLGAQRSKQTRD